MAAPRGCSNDDVGYLIGVIDCLRENISELREGIRFYVAKIEALQKENSELRARVKELVLQDERMIPDGCQLITDEQVDLAWWLGGGPVGIMLDEDSGERVPYISANSLGILSCPECARHPRIWSSTSGVKCPSCNGHGWIWSE